MNLLTEQHTIYIQQKYVELSTKRKQKDVQKNSLANILGYNEKTNEINTHRQTDGQMRKKGITKIKLTLNTGYQTVKKA